ncbi:MAG: hypothetical protein IJ934_02815 [Acetobacter sp.]|nr:hypothetical protein [Acetobacter sp.]
MILETIIGSVAGSVASKGADLLFKEEPKSKSSVGTLLTGEAIGGLGLLALGALAGSSDDKESQKAAGQISTGKNKVKK